MDFDTWLKKCDNLVSNEFGLGLHDFPDFLWYDAFEDGFEPDQAVEQFKEDVLSQMM
jgi:hypothetical protein